MSESCDSDPQPRAREAGGPGRRARPGHSVQTATLSGRASAYIPLLLWGGLGPVGGTPPLRPKVPVARALGLLESVGGGSTAVSKPWGLVDLRLYLSALSTLPRPLCAGLGQEPQRVRLGVRAEPQWAPPETCGEVWDSPGTCVLAGGPTGTSASQLCDVRAESK